MGKNYDPPLNKKKKKKISASVKRSISTEPDVYHGFNCSSLKGEAERLGTGSLWCQGEPEPETEVGDQGPAAPDQRTRNPWLKELMAEPC
ncbi:unnamed protein product [Boreogadus saida]